MGLLKNSQKTSSVPPAATMRAGAWSFFCDFFAFPIDRKEKL